MLKGISGGQKKRLTTGLFPPTDEYINMSNDDDNINMNIDDDNV